MKKKRISPPKVTDEEIRNFASSKGCNIIAIIRKIDAKNSTRLYINYACKCSPDTVYSSKWHRFRSNPQCKLCNKTHKMENKHQSVTKLAEENGCKIVKFDDTCGHTYVNYMCKCDGQKIWRKRIDKFESLPMCKLCIYKKNPRITYEDVLETVTKYNLIYVNHWRVFSNGCTKIIVEFICNCGNKKTCIRGWSSLSSGCNQCKEKRKKATNLKKYGVECTLQSEIVKNKSKATNLKKYGSEHYMQNSTARVQWEKSSYKYKKYTFPSGRTVLCQGYENWAYDLLLLYDIDEKDIITDHEICADGNIPQFWYEYAGKKKRYYPDIYIKSEKKFIEVKSIYTANYKPDIIQLKKASILASGFDFELWVFDADGYPNIM